MADTTQQRINNLHLHLHDETMKPGSSPQVLMLARLRKACLPVFTQFIHDELDRQGELSTPEVFTCFIICFSEFLAKFVAIHSTFTIDEGWKAVSEGMEIAYREFAAVIKATSETQNGETNPVAQTSTLRAHD